MEIRPLTPAEQRYTYASSTQIEGQTGTIGHLRGDFATTGYGFYTTWFDTRTQWKSDEFKAELDTVINVLREDKDSRAAPKSTEAQGFRTIGGFYYGSKPESSQGLEQGFGRRLYR